MQLVRVCGGGQVDLFFLILVALRGVLSGRFGRYPLAGYGSEK